jgi:hypothetical protein
MDRFETQRARTLRARLAMVVLVIGSLLLPAPASGENHYRVDNEPERVWANTDGTYIHARLLTIHWDEEWAELRVRDRTFNRYKNFRVPFTELSEKDRTYLNRHSPFRDTARLGVEIPGGEWTSVSLLREPPYESNVRLSVDLKGSRKISINLVDGVVSLLINSRPIKQARINDPEYLAAVEAGTLNEFFGVDWIRKDSDGNYDVPIKLEAFPLLGQDGPTCWAASFREWGWHLLGQRAPFTPALRDMQGFMNFIHGSDEGDFYSTEQREALTNLYSPDLPSRWLTLFTGAEVGAGVPVPNPVMVSNLLLSGHGVIGLGMDIRIGHAFAVIGTDRDKYFISTWEREYFGRGRLIPYPVEKVHVITPRRDERGAVMVPEFPKPRDSREARLLAKFEKDLERLEE